MEKKSLAFFDIDTQFDFMHPEGKLYVKGAETIIPNLIQLIELAEQQNILVISSVDAHDKDDPEFTHFPPHCIKGTIGQRKIPETLMYNNIIIANEPDEEIMPGARQIIVEKKTFDIFDNPNTERVIKDQGIDEIVLFGVATDYCVKAAALEAFRRALKVQVVVDAVKGVDPYDEKKALELMKTKGARLVKTKELLRTFAHSK